MLRDMGGMTKGRGKYDRSRPRRAPEASGLRSRFRYAQDWQGGNEIMNEETIEEFEKCEVQLQGLHEEIGLLSKKKPDGVVNKWKLKFANRVVEKANGLLGERYRPFGGFEGFEANTLQGEAIRLPASSSAVAKAMARQVAATGGPDGRPTNSDVVMMLAQYIKCMDQMRADNVYVNLGRWYWCVDGERSNLLTSGAKKLKK